MNTRAGILIALLAAGWVALGQRCLALGMDWYLAARYWFYAFPAYFSEAHFGAPRYTYFSELNAHFASGNPFVSRPLLESLLATANSKSVPVLTTVPLLFPADEKGTVDFVRFAFAMFGENLPSLLYFYFAILAASLALFVVRFRREPAALLTGVLALAALYVGTSALPITREVYSVINPRGVGSLSFIALVHLSLLALSKDRLGWRDAPALVFQPAAILLVVTMRSAESWQALALVAIAAAGLCGAFVHRAGRPVPWLRACAPVLPVLILLGGYQLYQRAAYPAEYSSTNVRNKIFWHNVLIGFALHPQLAGPYGLSLNDASVWSFVRYRAIAAHNPEVPAIFFETGLVKGFRAYDELCRQTILELAAKHPRQIVELYVWYKPRMLWRTLKYAVGQVDHDLDYYGIQDQASSLLSPEERRAQSAYYNPFAVVPLLLVAAGAAAAGRAAVRSAFAPATLAALATIAVFSLLPAFLTYPLVHVVVAGYISFTMLLYAVMTRAAVAALDRSWPRP